MLELEEALDRIISEIEPLAQETIPLTAAKGRYSAQDIESTVDLPRFDNSAMDGYAVLASDLQSASHDTPVALRLIGKVAAGAAFHGKLQPGTCVRVFTGSLLPSGAEAVVMQEDTFLDPLDSQTIKITDRVKPWENVRFKGEDVKKGAPAILKGEKISAPLVSLLASIGCDYVPVARRPVVGLLATGSELVEPGQQLEPGQIHESNRLGLAGFVENCGGVPLRYPLVPDALEHTVTALDKAFRECDVVVTSGGVSVGDFDFVKEAFQKLGGSLSFWKVAIKPGKPFVCGRLKNKFFFGVPGNPVSALVTFFLLVRPALLRLQGARNTSPSTQMALLKESLHNRGDRRHFMRISIDADGNARPTGIQASHILSSLAKADSLLDVPPRTELPQGSMVRVIQWNQ